MRCQQCGDEFEGVDGMFKTAEPFLVSGITIADRCPACGTVVTGGGAFEVLPDGSWRRLATALAEARPTRVEVQDLLALLHTALDSGAEAAAVAEAVERKGPQWRGLARWMASSGGVATATWLAALLAALAYFKSDSPPLPPPPAVNVSVHLQSPLTDAEIVEIVRQTMECVRLDQERQDDGEQHGSDRPARNPR
jgi:hypothetical protein